MNQIEIYKTEEGSTQIEVQFENDSVWLNRQQLSELFGRDIKTIGKHINNVFKEKELSRESVVANFATTANDGKIYQVEHYNLDVIISVGYRVKSKRGTQFRQWATQRLKDLLVQGYAINQKRLEQLQQVVNIVQQSGKNKTLSTLEAKGLLDIIANYTRSFVLLNRFDSNRLTNEQLDENITYEIQYPEAIKAIETLKQQLVNNKEATALFGNQKDESFQGILGNIVQTFGGEYLYKSIEEQSAHLLYFVIKNHPFSDGNKRIGAFLFIWFLEKNKHRFKQSGELKINDNGLVALALLVAQSNPDDKELMIQLIINLINNR
ncbi:MAG: virulence protein RhuM/Fic/DOC family protein [Chitinophagaceae bacterium]|nr:virulence protein RhuM/Fic/DOC family protein [Chitinophagaceae bacterium]